MAKIKLVDSLEDFFDGEEMQKVCEEVSKKYNVPEGSVGVIYTRVAFYLHNQYKDTRTKDWYIDQLSIRTNNIFQAKAAGKR